MSENGGDKLVHGVHPPAFRLKKDRRLQVAEFYSARGWEIPPLPWTNFVTAVLRRRILAERAESHWSNFVRFSQKAAVLDFAEEDEVFSLTDTFYGKAYSWMVTALGPNPDNGSQLLVFNLAVDPDGLADLPDDELIGRLATRPKPVRALRANACPCVLSYENTPAHLRSQVPNIEDLGAPRRAYPRR